MPITLINKFTQHQSSLESNSDNWLAVSELFVNSFQGEGSTVGVPATFLRLSGCHVGCEFCDTKGIWTTSQIYSFDEIIKLLKESDCWESLCNGSQHFVITGGAPLLQKDRLVKFLQALYMEVGLNLIVEIENEATIKVPYELTRLISIWNNSPKLNSSGVPKKKRYKPSVLTQLSNLPTSFFKFVVKDENDWQEIKTEYLDKNLIDKRQVILMPMGCTQSELQETRIKVAEIAMRECVRFSDRLHITLFNDKTEI